MDEGSLLANLKGIGILEFSRPFGNDQLAPFGFIIIERVVVHLLGDSVYSTRLLPLICGIAALFLLSSLSKRILPPRPALIAFALFALSDDLIYYSSELKPYSLDLLAGVAIILVTTNCLLEPTRRSNLIPLTALAIAVPWFSFPSAFMVAGCGITLLIAKSFTRPIREVIPVALIAALWAASFGLSYVASHRMLGQGTTMYVFWNFAFVPLVSAPLDLATWNHSAGIILETLVNPLNLILPLAAQPAAILAVLLLMLGNVAMFQRSRTIWSVLVLPILLAIIASVLRRYPFHGRLILELVPTCFVLIAAALERMAQLDRTPRKRIYKTLLVAVLLYPIAAGVLNSLSFRDRDFNQHGDLHENLFVS
jgi:uncharacterized membrane protein